MTRALPLLLVLLGCSGGPRWAFDPDAEEGVHGDVSVEWWYHFGFLEDDAGGSWGWFSSFFRAHGPLLSARYLIHELLDLKSGQGDYRGHLGSEALRAYGLTTGRKELPSSHQAIPGTVLEKAGDPLRLKYGEATLERTGDRTWRLRAGAVDLELSAVGEPMAVEGTGLTGLDRPDDMRYATFPRLEARGTVNGRPARGTLWYDHQWGSSWVQQGIGWSWWGLQLDDGSNLNAVVLRDTKSGAIRKATATHDHAVYPLEARAVGAWESPAGIRYPVEWELSAGPLKLRVEPLHRDREHPVLFGLETIWEGPVRVSGTRSGRGYQELVGYAKDGRISPGK
jgi:predicted secreted hydrolase